MLTGDRNPMRLVWLAVAGAALAASTWFLSFVRIPRVPVAGCGFWALVFADRLRFLAFLLPAVLGFALSIWAEKRFRRGFQQDLWTESELTRVRSLLAQPAWKWSGLAVLAGACASLVLAKSPSHGSFVYMLFLPLGTANRLRQLITPRTHVRSGLADWRNFGPLRSEHWGEPRT